MRRVFGARNSAVRNTMRTYGWLLRRAFISVYEEGCLGLAKSAAYSGLLSFFPVLTTVALLLVRFKAEEATAIIAGFLFEVVPPGTEEMVMRRLTVVGERPESLLVVAGLVSLWAASGLVLSLGEGYNAVYRVPSNRPLLRGRLVAILLVFGAALPALGATALIVLGTRTEVWLITTLGMVEDSDQLVGGLLWLGTLVRYLIALGATVVTSTLLYKVGPNRRQRWGELWRGAVVATVLWLGATLAFSWYVRNVADYNLLYGSIGVVIALLLWMYLLALTSMYGCAFNAERERLRVARTSLRKKVAR